MATSGWRTKVPLAVVLFVVLVGTVLLVVGAISGYIDEPLAAALTGSATLLLVGITAWYATATTRLSKQARDQTKAMLASHKPKLVVDHRISGSGISFDLHNSGEGPAMDIEMIVKLSKDDTVHEHRSSLSSSIRPGETVYNIEVHPSFRGRPVPEYEPTGTGSYPGMTPGTYEAHPLTPFLHMEWGVRYPIVRFRVEYADVLGNPADPITEFEGIVDSEALLEDWSKAFRKRVIEGPDDGLLTRIIDRVRRDQTTHTRHSEQIGLSESEPSTDS